MTTVLLLLLALMDRYQEWLQRQPLNHRSLVVPDFAWEIKGKPGFTVKPAPVAEIHGVLFARWQTQDQHGWFNTFPSELNTGSRLEWKVECDGVDYWLVFPTVIRGFLGSCSPESDTERRLATLERQAREWYLPKLMKFRDQRVCLDGRLMMSGERNYVFVSLLQLVPEDRKHHWKEGASVVIRSNAQLSRTGDSAKVALSVDPPDEKLREKVGQYLADWLPDPPEFGLIRHDSKEATTIEESETGTLNLRTEIVSEKPTVQFRLKGVSAQKD